jgi:hypothetical protein
MLTARVGQTVHTDTTVGERLSATVGYTVVAQNGATVIPSGARTGDQALIRLDFDRLEKGGKSYPLSANIELWSLKSPRAARLCSRPRCPST